MAKTTTKKHCHCCCCLLDSTCSVNLDFTYVKWELFASISVQLFPPQFLFSATLPKRTELKLNVVQWNEWAVCYPAAKISKPKLLCHRRAKKIALNECKRNAKGNALLSFVVFSLFLSPSFFSFIVCCTCNLRMCTLHMLQLVLLPHTHTHTHMNGFEYIRWSRRAKTTNKQWISFGAL